MPHEHIRQVWESTRTAYITNANAGLHLDPIHLDNDPLPGACLHARFGILVDALRTWHDTWPQDWSHHRIDWPTPGETRTGIATAHSLHATAD